MNKNILKIFILLLIPLLSGCYHAKEHLTINPDGSGILDIQEEYDLGVKNPTKEMRQNRITQDLQKSGYNDTLENFSMSKQGNTSNFHYQIKFSDVTHLNRSGLNIWGIKIVHGQVQDWSIKIGSANDKKMVDSIRQKQWESMTKAQRQAMDTSLEFIITFPKDITDVKGSFKKLDNRTARFYFSLMDSAVNDDYLTNPSIAWTGASIQ